MKRKEMVFALMKKHYDTVHFSVRFTTLKHSNNGIPPSLLLFLYIMLLHLLKIPSPKKKKRAAF